MTTQNILVGDKVKIVEKTLQWSPEHKDCSFVVTEVLPYGCRVRCDEHKEELYFDIARIIKEK